MRRNEHTRFSFERERSSEERITLVVDEELCGDLLVFARDDLDLDLVAPGQVDVSLALLPAANPRAPRHREPGPHTNISLWRTAHLR